MSAPVNQISTIPMSRDLQRHLLLHVDPLVACIERAIAVDDACIRAGRPADPTDTIPLTFRGSWESSAFTTLLRNAIAWGVGA